MVPAPTAGQLEPGAPARVPTFTPEGGDLIVIWNGACEPVSICAGENFLNQSALREAGLSGAQFLHSYLQRSAWVPYSEFKSHAARLLSGMARELPPFRLDFTLLNGQRLQTEIQIGLLPTPEPYRLISIVRDISARRLQEQRWSESESLCQMLLDKTSDVTFSMNAGGYFTYISPSVQRLSGYEPEELIGHSFIDFLHPDDLAWLSEAFATAVRGEVPDISECRIFTKAGSLLHLRLSLQFRHQAGSLVSVSGVMEDITEQTKVKEALAHSEVMFRTLIDNLNEASYTIDSQTMIRFISPSIETILGYSPAEMVGTSIEGYLADEDMQRIRAVFGQINSQTASFPVMEIRARHKAGHTVHLKTSTRMGYRGGPLYYINGIISDITEAASMREQLRQSQQRYSQLLENISDIAFSLDSQGRFTYLSPAIKTMLGFEPAAYLGQSVTALVHPADHDNLTQNFARRLATAEIDSSQEFRCLHADGHVPHLRASCRLQLDETGAFQGANGVITNISGLHEVLEQIKKSEKRYRLLADNVHDVIWTMDATCRYTYMSPSSLRLTGYTYREILELELEDFLSVSSATRLRQLVRDQLCSPASSCQIELEYRCKDGRLVLTESTLSFLRHEEGCLAEILGVTRDITERKQAELALRRAKEETDTINRELEEAIKRANLLVKEAESASVAKSEFLANMSHEIRTPMNGVIGIVEILRHTKLDSRQQRLTAMLKSSGEALLTIVNDILDFSKIEAGRVALENLDFDLPRLLGEVEDIMSYRAQEKGLKLNVLHPQDLPSSLRGDPGRIRQVLMNLIGNAIKFTETGEVSLKVEVLNQSDRQALLRFEVTDTGIGIRPERIDDIFAPFTQEDNSITRRYGGTGLGLSISRHLVEMMGGRIGVESRPGRGSTFWFTVLLLHRPLKAAERVRRLGNRQTGETPAETPADMTPGRHVLVVEDNEVNQVVILGVLENLGYAAEVACNGREALERLSRLPVVNLVLMDLQMPEMDGFETTRRIRDPRSGVLRHDLPIVAMTAHALKEDRQRCLDAGMDDYIAKPFMPDEVAAALERQLRAAEQA